MSTNGRPWFAIVRRADEDGGELPGHSQRRLCCDVHSSQLVYQINSKKQRFSSLFTLFSIWSILPCHTSHKVEPPHLNVGLCEGMCGVCAVRGVVEGCRYVWGMGGCEEPLEGKNVSILSFDWVKNSVYRPGKKRSHPAELQHCSCCFQHGFPERYPLFLAVGWLAAPEGRGL